jgi:hypothetical protein
MGNSSILKDGDRLPDLGFQIVMAVITFQHQRPRTSEEEFDGRDDRQYESIFTQDTLAKTMWLVFYRFAGVFPERYHVFYFRISTLNGYDNNSVLMTMAPAVIIMAVDILLVRWEIGCSNGHLRSHHRIQSRRDLAAIFILRLTTQ